MGSRGPLPLAQYQNPRPFLRASPWHTADSPQISGHRSGSGDPATQPELLFETDDVLIEASNWSLDGTSLILNGPWFTLASRPPDTEERATPVGRSAVGAGDLGGAGPARSAFAAGPAVGPGRGRCRLPAGADGDRVCRSGHRAVGAALGGGAGGGVGGGVPHRLRPYPALLRCRPVPTRPAGHGHHWWRTSRWRSRRG